MKVNIKSLWVFITCLSVVLSTHNDLLKVYPEWFKDLVGLAAFTVLAMNQRVMSNGNSGDNK